MTRPTPDQPEGWEKPSCSGTDDGPRAAPAPAQTGGSCFLVGPRDRPKRPGPGQAGRAHQQALTAPAGDRDPGTRPPPHRHRAPPPAAAGPLCLVAGATARGGGRGLPLAPPPSRRGHVGRQAGGRSGCACHVFPSR